MLIDVRAAQDQLARLIEAARRGEEVVIADGAAPVARLVAEPPARGPFVFDILKGRLGEGPDSFEPMDEAELRLWEGDGHPGDPAR